MAEWIALAAEWLPPVCNHIRNEVPGHGYVQIDQTPVRYLAPGSGRTKFGDLWLPPGSSMSKPPEPVDDTA